MCCHKQLTLTAECMTQHNKSTENKTKQGDAITPRGTTSLQYVCVCVCVCVVHCVSECMHVYLFVEWRISDKCLHDYHFFLQPLTSVQDQMCIWVRACFQSFGANSSPVTSKGWMQVSVFLRWNLKQGFIWTFPISKSCSKWYFGRGYTRNKVV